jgi:hypothetical protein
MSNKLNVDAAAVTKAVQAEIERQQSEVVYKDLSVSELEGVVQHLTSRLELCKDALAKMQDGPAKTPSCCGAPFPDATSCCSGSGAACASASTSSSAPALKATKVVGTWPDLPWTDRALRLAVLIAPAPRAPRPPQSSAKMRLSRCLSYDGQAGRREDHRLPDEDDGRAHHAA